MEHRWGERVRVDFPARITTHQFSVRHGRVVNLSVSGGYVEADFDARVLSKIKIAIMATHWSKHEAREISAYVTRKYRHGVGIEWCEFAPAEVVALLRTAVAKPRAYLKQAAHVMPPHALMPGTLLRHGT